MHSQKYRLVVITHSFLPAIGGVETFIEHLIGKLNKEKYDITIFTSDKNLKKQPVHYHFNNFSVHIIKSRNLFGIIIPVSLRNLCQLLKHLKNADVVHQHDIKFLSSFLYFLNFLYPYRLILFSHGYMYHSQRFRLLKRLFMVWFSFLSKRYKCIINISQGDFNLAKKYKFSNSIFIREAVELSKFWKLPKAVEKGYFLYFGRIARNKGLENLFTCLSNISQNYSLKVVGNGDKKYVLELQNFAKKIDLHQRITWEYQVQDDRLLSHISKAEIIFLPSLYEGFGISLLETIASRSRFIAHCNDSYTGILQDLNLSAFLFDFKKYWDFKSKLEFVLLSEPPECSLSSYDHDQMVNKIEAAQKVNVQCRKKK